MSAYWQYYEMNSEPFKETSAVYLPYAWEQQLGLLDHLSHHSQLVLLVIGLSGIGKTTLLHQFIKTTVDNRHTVKLRGESTFHGNDLLHLLAKRLSLPSHGIDSLLDQVSKQLTILHTSNQSLLLIIDDAHFLPFDTLTLMLNLAKTIKSFHVVLFGGPQLETKIAEITSQHLAEEVTYTLRMEPFDLKTTTQYLQAGLRAAGFNNAQLPFDEKVISTIHTDSEGIPAKINALTQRVLTEQALIPATHRSKLKLRWLVISVIGISILSLIYPVLSAFLLTIVNSTETKFPFLTPLIFQEKQISSRINFCPAYFSAKDEERFSSSPKAIPNQQLKEPTSNKAILRTKMILRQSPGLPLPANQSTFTPLMKGTPKLLASKSIHPITMAHKLKPTSPTFTLQFLATRQLSRAQHFIKTHHLVGKVKCYYLQTQAWYVVVYGEYHSIEAANKAIKALPSALQQQTPWVRATATLPNKVVQP